MTLLDALQEEIQRKRWRMAVTAALVGLTNVGILYAVNRGSEMAGNPSPVLLGSFALSLVVFGLASQRLFAQMAGAVESLLEAVRIRLSTKIQRLELPDLERLGPARIYDQISTNLTILSETTDAIAGFPVLAAIIVCNALYLAALSPRTFAITALWLGAALVLTTSRTLELRSEMRRVTAIHFRFVEALMDLLHGFKEVKLRRSRGDDLGRVIDGVAGSLRDETTKINLRILANEKFHQGARYASLGIVAFILPQYAAQTPEEGRDFIAGLLLLSSPLFLVSSTYPVLVRASTAASILFDLEGKLDEAAAAAGPPPGKEHEDEDEDGDGDGDGDEEKADPWGGKCKAIDVREVQFRYPGAAAGSFAVGPISFSLRASEVVFIVGSNGSGKSTLFHLLTGLYRPTAGAIVVDGIPVGAKNLQAYREMIAAVFSSFHLFAKLYGMQETSDSAVLEVLRELGLEGKVSCSDGRFSTLSLSTGQRKRLALLVALLEDRPIMAFDEWTAEQDQEYRRHFYEHLLPELKRRGKAIVVISHDDRFFHLADRIVTLHDGRLQSAEPPPPAPAEVGA
jgi:putative ATP-binding cassette transporter